MRPTLAATACGLASVVALAWLGKFLAAARGLRQIPDLLKPEFDQPAGPTAPSITVIVPARNEAADIQDCLRSLLAQDYLRLEILAVNDRSTDATGDLMDKLAELGGRLRVLHIRDLPPGWLGKTHAMATAARQAKGDFLLFTDADVIFRADTLRRSLLYATQSGADHMVTLPTTIIRRWDEAALLGFLQLLGLWAAPLWRLADPESRFVLGVGAFNMIRRSAYEQIGGFAALPLEIIEDVGLARRVKAAGLRTRVAFGSGLVSLHWAAGASGLVNVMTKNMFSAFGFRVAFCLLGCVWLVGIAVLPFAGLFFAWTIGPALVTFASVVGLYRLLGRHSGLSTWNALLTPAAGLVLVYALLRSMITTLRQGGVRWRGTFYSLAELRRNAPPLPGLRTRRAR